MAGAPPFVPPTMIPPPLPPGWTQHIAPAGQVYYHNAFTSQSTYIRPLPNFPMVPSGPPQLPVESKKREKPTNEGNTFYTNKAKKESVWTVPEGITVAVGNLKKEEAVAEAKKAEDEHREWESKEVERVKREVDEVVAKQKAEEPQPMDEMIVSKKARVEDAEEEEEEEDAEEDPRRQEKEAKLAEEEAKKAGINMPVQVDLSIEDAKAHFQGMYATLLQPLLPWNTALPQFASDPRFVLLPSLAARRKKVESTDPKEEFDRLLREEVKSTRTVWSDWRKAWKKDRRFYEKRAGAQKAEADFIVKRKLDKGPRYDSVGSSSLREEIFGAYVKTLTAVSSSVDMAAGAASSSSNNSRTEDEHESAKNIRKDRAALAVKERGECVCAPLTDQPGEGEGERDFRTLLTDAIRDPQIDPRLTTSPLPINCQIRLFHDHIAQLRSKHMQTLHGLLASHTPSLATTFADLSLSSLLSSPPATKMGLNSRNLEAEFARWQQGRTQAA
ncbi:hypothetical protein BD410DRAFT_816234 [Rickenella mellea]|uniref:WW domain-containing protein n=1 Tax=Rickenella mellea TaxID=50990 RepID=A0A4Y7PT73_9AGAM|nr:hypothetical protein BD410DRAFT_816234 [Rickenella mellea]